MCEYLGTDKTTDKELVEKCKDVLTNLCDPPTSTNSEFTKNELKELGFDGEKEVFVSGYKSRNCIQIDFYDYPWASYISEGNQPSTLEGYVHPSELISIGADPRMLEIAKNTFEYVNPLTPHTNGAGANGFTKTFTIAARLGIDPDKLTQRFSTTLNTLLNDKFLYDNWHSYEPIGSMEAINSMFLQNEHNEMRLFPCWSKKYDAKFVTLRAKNAHRVSSKMKDGKVAWAEIISDAGEDVTLVSPWENGIVVTDQHGNNVPIVEGRNINTNEVTYKFATNVNWIYKITEKTAVQLFTTKFIVDETQIIVETNVGEIIEMPAIPIKEGYTFKGWYTLATGGAEVTEYTTTQMVYAQWSKNEVPVDSKMTKPLPS